MPSTAVSRVPRLRWLLTMGVALLLALTSAQARADLPGPTDGGRAIVTESNTKQLADGIVHSAYTRIDPEGRNTIDVLTVDLSKTNVKYLDAGEVTSVKKISEMADEAGVDAAVNGDFFDINNSNASLGNGVSTGTVVSTANPDHNAVTATVGEDRLGAIADVLLDGVAHVNGSTSLPLLGVNIQKTGDGITAYDDHWGDFPVNRSLDGAEGYAVKVDASGAVSALDVDISAPTDLAEGERLLVARGAEAIEQLRAVTEGDQVEVSIGVSTDPERLQMAISGIFQVAEDGKAMAEDSTDDPLATSLNPRTAVGFGDGGKTMYLVSVDGRTDASRGMTLPELGRLMVELGASEAINLDGGGSTTLTGRDPGDADNEPLNNPSDGEERSVSNGIGVESTSGDGTVTGIDLEFPGSTMNADAVFPGLKRTLHAEPHDAGGHLVDTPITAWSSSDEATATVSDGVVTGVAPGQTEITAGIDQVASRQPIRVLGDLVRIEASTATMQFPKKGDTNDLTLIGYDAQGYSAPIDPADVTVTGDEGTVKVEPGTTSTFTLTSAVAEGTGRLTLQVQDQSVEVAYAIGQESELVTTFDEGAKAYEADGARSTITAEDAPGREDDTGVALTMDFSQDGATRTANLRPRDPMETMVLPGQPLYLTAWVKGDGEHQPMIYARVSNADDEMGTIYGDRIEATTEWQQVTFEVPAGYATPQAWVNIGFYETDASRLYTTTAVFDDVEVTYSPPVDAPEEARWRDSAVAAAGASDESPQRIAVMSDAQFVGADPDSALVAGARRTLREIVAQKPERVYIVGDLVDEGRDADFELARKILDEELGDLPWTYVPGNHEIMGGPIDTFHKHFGDSHTVTDLGSTRIITLNSSTGRLNDDFEQVRMLRSQLDAAEKDPGVTGVLVMFHHPTEDFLPSKASQLSDREEAALMEKWFAEFRASGKQIGVINGHVGAFHTRQSEGVIFHTNGNSGKNPSSTPDWGGWLGWTMLGVDPTVNGDAPATDWLTVETHPYVDTDSLTIVADDDVAAGDTVDLAGTLTQDGNEIPVAWPMSIRWSGEGVHVGELDDAPAGTRVVIDPRSMTATFLPTADGDVTVDLTVNGHTASHTFHIKGAPAPEEPEEPQPGEPAPPEPGPEEPGPEEPGPTEDPIPGDEDPADPDTGDSETEEPESGDPEQSPEAGDEEQADSDPAPAPAGDRTLPSTGGPAGALPILLGACVLAISGSVLVRRGR